MRNAFAAAITDLARTDPRIVLLSGDIGNRLFDKLKAAVPDRFLNCGVAEANMMTAAAGMALSGLRPFTYTITPFTTLRVLEQIRIDVCYHKAPVVIVGTGSGLSYASLGPTHHSCEDLAILQAIPNLTILCPADAAQTREMVHAAVSVNGPVYLRLGKKGEPDVPPGEHPLAIGQPITLRTGRDVCLLAVGTMTDTALQVGGLLQRDGVSAEVVCVHTIKPFPQQLLVDVSSRIELLVVIEEHGLTGGFGSAVADRLLEFPGSPRPRLLKFGTPDHFLSSGGSQDYARRSLGLDPESIAQRVFAAVRKSEGRASAVRGDEFHSV